MIEIGPTLETERLLLRPPQPEEFPDYCALMADPEVAGLIGGVQSPELVWRGLSSLMGAWLLNGFSMFSVIEKSSSEWFGRIGPLEPHGWPGKEVGWALKRSAWGKGYATEAARACVDYVVDKLGWSRIIHLILPENTSSIAVATRLGSKRQGSTRMPEPVSQFVCDIYGQSADEWRINRDN